MELWAWVLAVVLALTVILVGLLLLGAVEAWREEEKE